MRILAFSMLLALGIAGAAHAGANCVAEYSTVDSALVLCPAGDLAFHVAARIAPNVLAFRVWQIHLDVSAAPGLRLLAAQPDPGCLIWTSGATTLAIQNCDPFGYATFLLSGGGCGTGVAIPVGNSHDGVILATRVTYLSPDQNGDLVVDGEDMGIVAGKLGTHDPTADFDFDGTVTAADLAIAQAHLGHLAAGSGPVAAHASTWGRIKSLSR
jgi:hypothetical protein